MLRNTGGKDLHRYSSIHAVLEALEFGHLVFYQASYSFAWHHNPTTVVFQTERSVPSVHMLALRLPNDDWSSWVVVGIHCGGGRYDLCVVP